MTKQEVDQVYLHSDENHNDILREATELVEHGDALEDEPEINVRRRTSAVGQHTDRTSHLRQREHAVKYFWTHHIAVTVSHTDCRDHFALERTYLSYLRTSLAFAILGTTIAQLFRLQIQQNPDSKLGLFTLGIPLACVFIGTAIGIAILGAFRFWRQQNALARGKVHAGGWEMNITAAAAVTVTLAIFILILVLDVDLKDG